MERPETRPAAEVIRQLRLGVARNPGDPEAGLLLGSALYQSGDLAGSAAALEAVLRQHPDHLQSLLLLARTEARAGDPVAAIKTLARARQADPANSQAWQVASALLAELRNWPELYRLASDWTRTQPDCIAAWQALSRAHFENSRFAEAITAFSKVLELEPGNAAHQVGAARLAIAAQQYEQARRYLDQAQHTAPDAPDLLYTLGRLHHMTGELAVAEQNYRDAIAARPGFATAYVELGTLVEGRLSDVEVQAINQLFGDQAVHPEYRVMLGFTLGDALDRRNLNEQAFKAWHLANGINRQLSEQEGFVHRRDRIEDELALLTGLFDGEALAEPVSASPDQPRPIFVVGMPRSGTTLVESILASHTEVYGAGELPTLYDIHEELLETAHSQGIEAARDRVRREAGNWRTRYLAALPVDSGATQVVDKQPLNFRSVGLIRLLFPESPILYTRRSPMDVGLSIYRHKFAKSWPCAHSLADIGHYYGFHARVMELWHQRYPGAIYCVDHARLVQDPQTEINSLLTHAGLSAQPACFEPHKTRRPIATFSSAQVRQPLSAAFSGRARRYNSQLAPLREALVQAGIDPDQSAGAENGVSPQ